MFKPETAFAIVVVCMAIVIFSLLRAEPTPPDNVICKNGAAYVRADLALTLYVPPDTCEAKK